MADVLLRTVLALALLLSSVSMDMGMALLCINTIEKHFTNLRQK